MEQRMVTSRLLPPLLLVVVAVVQIVLAQTGDLTPWKGGGFGMFATLDHGAYRNVDIVVAAPDRSEGLEIPESLETAVARAAAFPADWLMRALAEGVAAREKRHHRAVSRVTMTVWGTVFDPVTLRPSERPLRTFVYTVP
jgi:hypothetical protein